ncbi:MAG: GIY-YIG nuclease family protein [Candidatus Omnitrophica bacterium]|nr:GIY-YIG nuclease family protein [Candidatus Omnitrophota bacterium]
MAELKEQVENLPDLSGVYIIKDSTNRVLYVGKASSLRQRVRSYFSPNLSPAKLRMIQEAFSIDYIVSRSEAAALILEAALIKELNPPYNIELKDDKSYPYVVISNEDYPYLTITRRRNLVARYFGPYAKAGLLREALSLLRKIFPFRSCRRLPSSACLFYDLKLCPAPCIQKVDKNAYRQNLKGIIMVLEGERKDLIEVLERKMRLMAKRLRFEEAALLKQKIEALQSLYFPEDEMLEVVDLKETAGLLRLPLHIETIDISNLAGKESTGSVVVFREGRPCKDMYRRFKIKGSAKGDIAMMTEVAYRRLVRLKREGSRMPDLLVLDGGPAHIAAVLKVVRELQADIEVVALAKRGRDKLWLPGRDRPLRLPSNSRALRLLQRARDEAHRFARRYHLLVRKKKVYE